ncbi:MAG: polysaccharide deacetylase family protein [Chthoniobacterales bacterium]|nr:polysaccharide deacetylase family protein [Chthoniobacterales bacterium]
MNTMRKLLFLACSVWIGALPPYLLRAEDIAIPYSGEAQSPSSTIEPAAPTPTPALPAPQLHPGGPMASPAINKSPEYAEMTPSPAASSESSGKLVRPGLFNSVYTSQKVVALTFDDGPHGQLTPKLLDILRAEDVPATFFVLGSNVSAYPDIARRIVNEGHEIANHSWDHPSLPKVSAERLDREIRRTSEIIEQTTGQKVTIMRPTYGALNERVQRSLINDYGLDVILWSVDPRDWKRPGADVVTRRLVTGAHPGAILLAHDIHPGTIAAMPQTISQLKAKGYRFVTVSQLLAMAEPPPPPTPKQDKTRDTAPRKPGQQTPEAPREGKGQS